MNQLNRRTAGWATFRWTQILSLLLLSLLPGRASGAQAVPAVNDGESEVVSPTEVQNWDAWILCDGGKIRFGLELQGASDADTHSAKAFLINGPERIEVPQFRLTKNRLLLTMDHYDSVLDFQIADDQSLSGTWRKRRGAKEVIQMKAAGVMATGLRGNGEKVDRENQSSAVTEELNHKILGRWKVQFESSQDPAVGVFQANGGRVLGTFLTTTGDYRFLDGVIETEGEANAMLWLSCFDGAHAFLFKAQLKADGTLAGDFWSSNTWHETWTAEKDENARLPDSFKQTSVTELSDLSQYRFPDLDGKLVALDDQQFAGKARIIYVFGSWCPNCHDAAVFFSGLHKEYADKGLSVLGLAFELTGDHKRDADQVRKYLQRHDCHYPVLIAGLSDKDEASKALPILDRIRSYPTTIFLDGSNKIVAIHTGFSGPATGAAHEELKTKFREIIDRLLQDKP